MQKEKLSDAELRTLLKGDPFMQRRAHTYIFAQTDWEVFAHNFVRRNSGSKEEAEDCFWEAFFALERRVQEDDGSITMTLDAYFKGILKRTWYRYCRDHKKINFVPLEDDFDPNAWNQGLKDESPEWIHIQQAFADPSLKALLHKYLENLGKHCPGIFELDLQGFSQAEIADILEIQGGADQVKKEKGRCKERMQQNRVAALRQELKDRLDDLIEFFI